MASLTDTLSLLSPQDRADQGLLRALGREVLRSLPPVDYAFSYGSSAMPQFDPITQTREPLPSILNSINYSNGDKMFDIIIGVENPYKWHDENIRIMDNSKHYSFIGRNFRLPLVTKYWDGVFFHPNTPIHIQDKSLLDAGVPPRISVKYGVTSMDNVVSDCLTWSSLYLAGRLHKPVTILQDNPHMTLARELNLHHAVAYSLLHLPSTFTELDLYTAIANISYDGDIRHRVGAEDVNKIHNLVRGALPFYRELYGGVLTSYLKGAGSLAPQTGFTENALLDMPSDAQIPLYHKVPKLGGPGAENPRTLPVFKNYHDVYKQMSTADPSQIIFTQPDTLQHKAMLYASLPSSLTLHRAAGTTIVNKKHEDMQNEANDVFRAAADPDFDKNKRNDGTDHSEVTPPSTGVTADTKAPTKAPVSVFYRPPRTGKEKQIPILPPILHSFPYQAFSYAHGPSSSDTPMADFSAFGKFDRQKIFLRDSKRIKQLIAQSLTFRPITQNQNQGNAKLISGNATTATTTNSTAPPQSTAQPANTHKFQARKFSTLLRPQTLPNSKRQSIARQRNAKFSTTPTPTATKADTDVPVADNAFKTDSADNAQVDTSDKSDPTDPNSHIIDIEAVAPASEPLAGVPQPARKTTPSLQPKTRKLISDESDDEAPVPSAKSTPPPATNVSTNTTPPARQEFLKSHQPGKKSSTGPTIAQVAQGRPPVKLSTSSSSSNRLQPVTSLYTTTVSDVLAVEQTLETPRQAFAFRTNHNININNSRLDPAVSTNVSALNQELAETVAIPNQLPSSIVLPTVSPLSLTQALDNNTTVQVLNVGNANDTTVRAVEIPITTDEKSAKKFSHWGHFNTHSNFETLKKLPIIQSNPIFQTQQLAFRQIMPNLLKNMGHERNELISQRITLRTEIQEIKNALETKLIDTVGTKDTLSAIDDRAEDRTDQISKDSIASIKAKEEELDKLAAALEPQNADSLNSLALAKQKALEFAPGLFNAYNDLRTINFTYAQPNRVLTLPSAVTYLSRAKPDLNALNQGLMVQGQDATVISSRHSNKNYVGLLVGDTKLINPRDPANVLKSPTYSLLEVPQYLPGQDKQPSYLITAQLSTKLQLPRVDRDKLQADPWHYDRLNLARFDDLEDNATHQIASLTRDGALPDHGLNKYADRRQRWQVYSSFNADDVASELKLLGKDLAAEQNGSTLEAYQTALSSTFINVKPAHYDARRHSAGVARADNSVNLLQYLTTAKLPIFGSSLMSAQLRSDLLPIYRHHILSQEEIRKGGGDDQGVDAKLPDGTVVKVLPFSQLVHPLTNIPALRSFVTDAEFAEQYQSGTITPSRTKAKQVEFLNSVVEWEKTLAGEYNSPDAVDRPDEILNTIISSRRRLTIHFHSKRNAKFAFWTAGPIKSIKYAFRKLTKGRNSQKAQAQAQSPSASKAAIHTQAKRDFHTKSHHLNAQKANKASKQAKFNDKRR